MPIQLSDHFTYRKLIRFTLPSIAMMIFTSIYGVVDGFFVSNFAGKTPFAAVNLIMPFLMIVATVGFMFGTGGTAIVAKTFGEGDREKANRYFSLFVYVAFVLGVVFAVLGIVFLRPISIALGAEGELLEKFNIQLSPIPLPELTEEMKKAKAEGTEVANVVSYCNTNMCVKIKPEELENVAALKVAMKNLAAKYSCNAIAIQCWNALQGEIGIMPCAANSLLNEEGIPVVCETDIHGAITALMVEAAGRNDKRSFFADWTVRHPDNENGELLQHCGPWPISVAQEKPTIGYPLAFSHPGAVEAQAKLGEMTLARFDGDNGEYSLLLGNAKGVEGPYTKGTYVWVEVQNLKRLEAKIVEGPYIHHCVGIHENVVPVLYEACKYIGIAPDLYDPIEEDVKAYLRGE